MPQPVILTQIKAGKEYSGTWAYGEGGGHGGPWSQTA